LLILVVYVQNGIGYLLTCTLNFKPNTTIHFQTFLLGSQGKWWWRCPPISNCQGIWQEMMRSAELRPTYRWASSKTPDASFLTCASQSKIGPHTTLRSTR